MHWLTVAVSLLVAAVVAPPLVRGLREQGFVRQNYRDAPVAFPNGILNSLPKKQLAIAWGACLGVGLGLLLLLGWLDQTAGEPADIEKKLGGVRVLAKIPLMKPGTRP